MNTKKLFDLEHTLAKPLLEKTDYPWEVLPQISEFVTELGKTLSEDKYTEISPEVWVAKTAKIAPTAYIASPCIIGENTEVRQCAFIRGSALIGDNCVIGNSTEVKNSIIFDNVQVPHFNYVGDSVLGYKSHLGAGAVTSNVKSDKTEVTVLRDGERVKTGRKKFGAMVGDCTEVGCNSVLCPGTVTGKNCTVYPLSRVRGFVPENTIVKGDERVTKR